MSSKIRPGVITISYGPNGRRALPSDYSTAADLKAIGFPPPTRHSHVEMITSGPYAWQWYVDFSPAGEKYQFCLWPPSATRDQALFDEQEHIKKTWLVEDA